jgi:hypothetical protein
MRPSEIAAAYIGQKELQGNIFKDDTPLGKKLHAAGQHDGDPWCALFCEVVFKEALPDKFKELDKLFSASAVQTYKNFVAASYVTGELPAVDWMVIWQKYVNGEPQWQGHAGIVSKLNPNDKYAFESIEGNTNGAGSREGDQVAVKVRQVIKDVKNGLRVLGFVKIT